MSRLDEMNFFDPQTVECPFAFYQAARAEAPVYKLPNSPIPGRDVWLVTPYKLVHDVLRDWKTFSNRFAHLMSARGQRDPDVEAIMAEGFPPVETMLTQDPPAQRNYRNLVNKAFSAGRVNSMEGYIRQICDELIDAMSAATECDFFEAFAIPLPVYVIADQLGVPRTDLPRFKRWSDDVIASLSQMGGKEEQLQGARSVVEMHKYFAAVVESRRAAPKDDIISDIANATLDEGRLLTLPEALSIIQQLLVAGNETTTNALAGGLGYILQTPGLADKLAADPSLIPNTVEEILRLEAPTKHMWRIVKEDTELGGVALPEGAILLLSYDAANRDEGKFEDGDAFDPCRGNAGAHLSFGMGIHFCVGALLARKEMTIAYQRLFARLTDLRLTPGRNELRHIASILHRGLTGLHISYRVR
ncbi:MAG: cytochrome P450 [Alphaproteobacteria bacterium]|nr:cytochrome P450 [Alphaproteobacteria bacterium]